MTSVHPKAPQQKVRYQVPFTYLFQSLNCFICKQVTVRSSPLVPETVPVCKQCHKNCITSNGNVHTFVESLTNGTNYKRNDRQQSLEEDDWQPLLLLGLCANPAASLVKLDPFIPQVPKISVEAATPESSTKTAYSSFKSKDDCQCQNLKKEVNIKMKIAIQRN